MDTGKRLDHRSLLSRAAEVLPQLLFIAAAVISVFTTYYATEHFLDSDVSSELVLAHHLAETGQILSRDWLYSTELKVLHMQLIYIPLFRVFDDWHLVHYFGALIIQAMMILSYAFLIHETGLSKRVFYLGASLLLLPVSVCYGRIVLYNSHYAPNITLSFFLVGLVMGFAKTDKEKKPVRCIRFLLLMLFSFIGGLSGVRQLMMTHVPMIFSIFLCCFIQDHHKKAVENVSILSGSRRTFAVCALLAALASFVGLKINTELLSKYYLFNDQAKQALNLVDGSLFDDLLFGYFHQFGFRTGVGLLTIPGILSLGGIAAGGYVLFLAVQKLAERQDEKELRKVLLQSFFLSYTLVMFVVLMVSGDVQARCYFVLYRSLTLSWAVPLVLTHLEELPGNMHPLHIKKLSAWAVVLILFANGLANVTYFNGGEAFDQVYEGLSFIEADKQEKLTDVVAFLSDNGYDIGYATFWEGNIVTEMSDGQIQINNVNCHGGNGNLWYYDWLTSLYLREAESEKPFLLLNMYDKDAFERSDSFPYCVQVYEDENHCVYEIVDIEEFKALLYS